MGEIGKIVEAADELAEPVKIGPEAYISEEYARAEQDRLWRKVWLQAGRVEDIPNPGDYITYDILTDSVIIMRGDDGEIRRRGRSFIVLVETINHAGYQPARPAGGNLASQGVEVGAFVDDVQGLLQVLLSLASTGLQAGDHPR